jgi:2'-5' RNA ligase
VIRLFAALPVGGPAARRLALLQAGLEGRTVDPASFHVTLAFFGEVAEPVAEELHAALGSVEAPQFAFWLDGVGAFGGKKPTAIYAAVRPEPALDRLQAKVAQAARRAGVALEARRFTPHVTLARYAAGTLTPEAAAKALAARGAFLAGPVAAEVFHLYRSDLGRGGPAYAALADYPLRRSGRPPEKNVPDGDI